MRKLILACLILLLWCSNSFAQQLGAEGIYGIGHRSILEKHLKTVNSATDEQCLTYEATVGDFEWQACGSGAGDVTDVWACTSGNCNALTAAAGDTLNATNADTTISCKVVTDCSGLTAEGSCCWDSDNDNFYIGDGAAVVQINSAGGDITTVGTCTTGNCAIEGGTDIFPFIYEGTADEFETTFVVTDPTTPDKTITFPNETGTVCTSGSVCSGYQGVLTNSAGLAGALSDESGTDKVAFTTSPVFTTPNIGSATGSISGNAATATALAADPADCAANQFANAINASGTLTCAALADADVPDTITINTATLASTVTVVDSTDATSYVAIFDSATGSLAIKTDAGMTYAADTGILTATGFAGPLTGAVTGNASTASALAADPANCAAGQIALGVTAAGVAECTATPSGLTSVGATTFTGALTGNASTASVLAANGANCNAGNFPLGVDASGAVETCTDTWTQAEEDAFQYIIHKTLELPTDADNFLLLRAPEAIVITNIYCIVDPAGAGESVVIDIQECDGTADNCATVDATITCDNDGAEDDGGLSNGAIDSGDWIALDIGTVTGTVTQVAVTIHYTR